MFVIEEASGVEQEIIEVIEGAITKPGNKLIMVGNPTKINGAFYDAFNKDRAIYKTYTFNSEDSENVDQSYIDRMIRYGRDSDIYRVRVRGEFPKGEPDTFITLDKIEHSLNLEDIEEWNYYSIGVDPARFGDDESIICYRKGFEVQPLIAFQGIDTVRLAGEVIKVAREIWASGYKDEISVKVDDTGIGGGVSDQLNNAIKQQWDEHGYDQNNWSFNIKVIPVVNNGKPTDHSYKDKGSEMWGIIRDSLATVKIPNDDELIAQLTTRKYKVEPNGQVKLEKKDEMKRRKLPSPDRGDALGLCLAEFDDFNMKDDTFQAEYKNESNGSGRRRR
jgi:hypothetical protein